MQRRKHQWMNACVCVCVFLWIFFTNQLVLWVRSILWIDVTLCRSRCRLREESCLSEIERVGKGLYFQKYLRLKHELRGKTEGAVRCVASVPRQRAFPHSDRLCTGARASFCSAEMRKKSVLVWER